MNYSMQGVLETPWLYEEIGNIIAEILSPWEKAEDFKEVGNHSQRIFTSVRFLIVLCHNC